MKKRDLKQDLYLHYLFLEFFLCFISLIIFARAVPTGPGWQNTILGTVFGLKFPYDWKAVVSTLVVFLVFWFAFADILSNFSGFSGWVCWFIGFAIAMFTAFSDVCLKFAMWMLGWSAILGEASVFIAVGTSFFVFMMVHLGVTGLGKWIRKRQNMYSAQRISQKVMRGAEKGAAVLAGAAVGIDTAGNDAFK